MNDVATIIKTIRQRYSLSQQEIADRLEVGQSAISRWENGEQVRMANVALKLGQLLIQLDKGKKRKGEKA